VIYEVAGVIDGKLIEFESHMQRYHNSADKLGIAPLFDSDEILTAFRKLITLNQLSEGMVYMQVTAYFSSGWLLSTGFFCLVLQG